MNYENKKFPTRVKALFLNLIVLFGFMVGCSDEIEFTSNDVEQQREESSQSSEIELIELEFDVTLFKKDLVLKSPDGSEVVLRVASPEREILDNLLASYDFNMTPMFHSKPEVKEAINIRDEDLGDNEPDAVRELRAIYTEVISQSLSDQYNGFKIDFDYLENANGRLLFNLDLELISPTWPEFFVIQPGNEEVNIRFTKKKRWYSSGWQQHNVCHPIPNGGGVIDCPPTWTAPANFDMAFDIDGPWKFTALILYDTPGSFSYYWIH
jgi:hypothetical protein